MAEAQLGLGRQASLLLLLPSNHILIGGAPRASPDRPAEVRGLHWERRGPGGSATIGPLEDIGIEFQVHDYELVQYYHSYNLI